MSDVYDRLAQRLDRLTNGYPRTKSGVELKILRKIFSEEDAERALKLRPYPETAPKLAKRFGMSVEDTRAMLDEMASKGQIGSFAQSSGEQGYMLAPFVIGFWEFQVDHLDRELSDLFDEYYPELVKRVGGHKPTLARVVPQNASIDAELQVLNYEDMRELIATSKAFQLMECICRKKKDIQGTRECSHSTENCLIFFRNEGALDYFHFAGRVISREEALEVFEQTERDGLVHCTYNTRSNQVWVCNCCPCCCDLLIGLNEHKAPHLLARSDFIARLDQDTCSECGICADERCPTDAIYHMDDGYVVKSERCIGCGVCVPSCPTDSLKLERRPKKEQEIPSSSLETWYLKRGLYRVGAAIKDFVVHVDPK